MFEDDCKGNVPIICCNMACVCKLPTVLTETTVNNQPSSDTWPELTSKMD